MTSFIEEWVNASPENRRAYRQEGLILDVTERIWERMEELDLTPKGLAERLGTSQSHVSSLLSGSRNMTLRTLSDIADAVECDVKIELEPREDKAENIWFTGTLEPALYHLRVSVPVTVASSDNDGWRDLPKVSHG